MTTKKTLTKKARLIRATIKGLTLPQSVKLAKALYRGDKVAVAALLDSYGYTVVCDIDVDDDGVMTGTCTISKGAFSVTVPYEDGIIPYNPYNLT